MNATSEIALTRGKVAVVDADDVPMLSAHKWHAFWNGKRWYAKASPRYRECVLMHRMLLDAMPGQLVDHRDNDGLNNTRSNIRLATNRQNLANSCARSSRVHSKFKGVYWARSSRKWFARLQVSGEYFYAKAPNGTAMFVDEIDAARAFNELAATHHGEFARFNQV